MAQPPSEQYVEGAVACAAPMTVGCDITAPPRYFLDATLLFRCMDILQIDRRRLAADEPLLFRELQAVCTLCRNKEACLSDLVAKSLDPGCDDWFCYCPNAAILTTIGASQRADGARPAEAARWSRLSHLR